MDNLKIGDNVIVDEPSDEFEPYCHGFLGTIIRIEDNTYTVEDQDGDVFDVEHKYVDKALC